VAGRPLRGLQLVSLLLALAPSFALEGAPAKAFEAMDSATRKKLERHCQGAQGMNACWTRIGSSRAEAKRESELFHEELDRTPIVLWRGGEPAGVLAYRVEAKPYVSGAQIIDRVDDHPGGLFRRAPFPLEHKLELKDAKGAKPGSDEGFRIADAILADIDGDGVDELILPRPRGLEVHGLGRELFRR
jgi:hypothetical protein